MKQVESLEYPRHVHKADGEFLVVQNAEDCADALKGGWSLTPVVDAPVEEPVDPKKKK